MTQTPTLQRMNTHHTKYSHFNKTAVFINQVVCHPVLVMAWMWGKLCLYAGGFSGLIVRFNPHPFAEGSTKQSHEAYYGSEAPVEKHGLPAVIKIPLDVEDRSPLSIKKGLEFDIKTHETAAEYASIWNKIASSSAAGTTRQKHINVQVPSMIQLRQSPSNGLSSLFRSDTLSEYVTVEDYLDGNWQKFNSNTGWTQNEESVLNAFSHWTYHHSKGEHLVCDLQGIDCDGTDSYELTDPVVMSKDKSFGATDLGIVGISNWFYHHQCGEHCDAKWIKPDRIEKSEDIDCEQETSHSLVIGDLDEI